jgi:hypothetical protein
MCVLMHPKPAASGLRNLKTQAKLPAVPVAKSPEIPDRSACSP